MAYSNYYDTALFSRKGETTLRASVGITVGFQLTRHLLFETGCSYSGYSNAVGIHGNGYFKKKEGFDKIHLNYEGLSFPFLFKVEYQVWKNIKLRPFLGILANRYNWFSAVDNIGYDIVKQQIGAGEAQLEYQISLDEVSIINYSSVMGLEIYQVLGKHTISLALVQNLAVKPVFSFGFDYEITLFNNQKYLGAGYSTSKGDYLALELSWAYRIRR